MKREASRSLVPSEGERPTSLVVATAKGLAVINKAEALGILEDPRLDPYQIQSMFNRSIVSLAQAVVGKRMTGRELTVAIRALIDLDDSIDEIGGRSELARVRRALSVLPNGVNEKVIASLPAELMIELGCIDCGWCSAKRFAAYIREKVNRFTHASFGNTGRESGWTIADLAARESKRDSRAGPYYEQLVQLLDLAVDRDEEDCEDDFLGELAQELKGRGEDAPEYVVSVLEFMVDRGVESAEVLLERMGLQPRDRVDFEEDDW